MIRDYVALDLETSGLNPSENQIIEIGMAKVCDGEITETYSRLLNPKEKLSQRIVELTGITDEMVAGQPHVSEVIDEIVSFIGELPLLGHNIIFDYISIPSTHPRFPQNRGSFLCADSEENIKMRCNHACMNSSIFVCV